MEQVPRYTLWTNTCLNKFKKDKIVQHCSLITAEFNQTERHLKNSVYVWKLKNTNLNNPQVKNSSPKQG